MVGKYPNPFEREFCTHNPEVAGSNPAPATKVRGPFRSWKGPFACLMLTDLLTGSWFTRLGSRDHLIALGGIAGDLYGRQRPANDQLGERSRYLAVRLQIALDVLLHCERYVGVSDPVAQRLPIDLRVASCCRVAVPHIMQVDLRQISRCGELVEPAGDGVWVRWPPVLPAEQ